MSASEGEVIAQKIRDHLIASPGEDDARERAGICFIDDPFRDEAGRQLGREIAESWRGWLTLASLKAAFDTIDTTLDHEGNAVIALPHRYKWTCGFGHGGTTDVDDVALVQAYHDHEWPKCKGVVHGLI